MKKIITLTLILLASNAVYAERYELNNGTYVDEYGDVYDNKYENTDIFAPWNNSLQKDDIFAPWNDSLQKDDIFAPWNNTLSSERDTNQYLRDQGVRDSNYYWQ